MNQLALQTSTTRHVPMGAVGTISLNYNEVKCLDMALYFLTEQLNVTQPPPLFMSLRDYHVRNLKYWLNNSNLRRMLRFDSKNSVNWPVVSLEDAEWLNLALMTGITEDTIISMAADDANYERDMAMMYAETDGDYSLAEEAFNSHFRAFQQYYCQIARSADVLTTQLQQILNDSFI